MSTLDPEIITTVQAVATKLAETEPAFLELLRRVLGGGSQPVREPRIATLLGESALRAARFEDPPEVAAEQLRTAGKELYRLGFDETRHQAAMKAMLKVLQEVYPLEWTSSSSSTWIGFFFWVREHWLEGAVAARAAGPQAEPATP
jgi:hypothetical protein